MRELPSGTVTFLFTDIEGSTRLLHELGDRYAEVLTEHGRLVREACGQYGGRVVDTQGDSFFVAFGDARDAVTAAAEVQKALAEHGWPDGVAVRVRMGIHTGEPLVVDTRDVVCDRLPPIATTSLHKGSIFRCQGWIHSPVAPDSRRLKPQKEAVTRRERSDRNHGFHARHRLGFGFWARNDAVGRVTICPGEHGAA